MRILVLANKIPYPPKDGGALATYNMLKGLVNAGAKVSLVAMSTPKHPGSIEALPSDFKKSIDTIAVDVNTHISLFSAISNLLFSRKPYNAVRFEAKCFQHNVDQQLRANRFDVVQLEGLYLVPYIKEIRKYFTGPISLRAHNVEWEIWSRASQNQRNPIKRWYFANLAKRISQMEHDALGQIDWLIPITNRDAHMLNQMGFKGLTFVSQVGYDLNLSPVGSGNSDFEHPSIFHLGGLDWLPNQEGIIWFLNHCWPIILAKFPSTRFYIAGRNAPRSLVKQITEHPNTTYCGEVPDAAQFIHSKGIMVVPLLTGSGMRVKIVEGMTLGKAIVSTTIGAEGIDAQDGKQILIADSPDDFVVALEKLLLDKAKIIEMGKDAKAFALSNFDNLKLTSDLYNFYKQNIQK